LNRGPLLALRALKLGKAICGRCAAMLAQRRRVVAPPRLLERGPVFQRDCGPDRLWSPRYRRTQPERRRIEDAYVLTPRELIWKTRSHHAYGLRFYPAQCVRSQVDRFPTYCAESRPARRLATPGATCLRFTCRQRVFAALVGPLVQRGTYLASAIVRFERPVAQPMRTS
jgi:hypothetical protein